MTPTPSPTNNQPPIHPIISMNNWWMSAFWVAILHACLLGSHLCYGIIFPHHLGASRAWWSSGRHGWVVCVVTAVYWNQGRNQWPVFHTSFYGMMLEISELLLPAIVVQILQAIKELVCLTFDNKKRKNLPITPFHHLCIFICRYTSLRGINLQAKRGIYDLPKHHNS